MGYLHAVINKGIFCWSSLQLGGFYEIKDEAEEEG